MKLQGFLQEFKAFAMKGNVIDLAVAVVIGAAFGKIVSSLVDNVITPLIGSLMGGIDFSNLSYTVGNAVVGYGIFIQAIINFLIVAFAIFIVVRIMNKAQKRFEKKEEEKKAAEPAEEILLLREIRDSVRGK